MKKSMQVVLGLALLLSVSSAYAALPFSLGVKGGINIASTAYNPDLPAGITNSSQTLFMFGAVAELGLGGPVYVQVEPMYVQKGGKAEGSIFVNENHQVIQGSETNKAAFLEIPILLKVKLQLAGPVNPYAFAGPTIGFTLSSKITDEATGYPSTETDVKDQTSSTDFGLTFGAGVEFKAAPTIALTLDGRYALGLTDLAKTQPGEVNHTTVKSRGIQIMVGVMFRV